MKMKNRMMNKVRSIAIVGATTEGGRAVAKSLAGRNYRLLLMSDDVKGLGTLRQHLITYHGAADIAVGPCAREAAWEADIIVLTTDNHRDEEVASKIGPVATGKTVIRLADPEVDAEENTNSMVRLRALLPHSKVIKAYLPDRNRHSLDREAAVRHRKQLATNKQEQS